MGDAGKHEVVMYAGKAWVTPDTPTLVDLPKGAQVFPDVSSIDLPVGMFRNGCSLSFSHLCRSGYYW